MPPVRQQLLAKVRKRVRLWRQLPAYYPGSELSSRGPETVLNALILADEDARQGHLSEQTRSALDEMWALKRTSEPLVGSWPWIQFGNEPQEAPDSVYYRATLAALAVGIAQTATVHNPPFRKAWADYTMTRGGSRFSDMPISGKSAVHSDSGRSRSQRRNHSPAFKARVALEALKGEKTVGRRTTEAPGS